MKLVRGASIFIITFSFFLTLSVFAQQSAIYKDGEWHYKLGYELYQKEKYSAAAEEFEKALSDAVAMSSESRTNAEYYKAVSHAELFQPGAEAELFAFVNNHPESLKSSQARFQLARIYYKQKKNKNAIEQFEKTDIAYLKNDEITEYYFKTGYSYFALKDYDKANRQFKEILKVDSKYQTAATYYYGHIAYANNNYNTALETFNKLKDSETFGPLVPYYIIQIYFEQEKYDDVIRNATTLLNNDKVQNATDIKRLVAESYYRLGKYDKAIEFFEDYNKNSPVISREDKYQIAVCYYKNGNYDKAKDNFQKVVEVKDKTAQNAYYHLADCFLKLNDKQSARNALQSASKMDYDKEIKEEALFSYAKLTYELNFQPLAIRTFNEFIKAYPASKHIDEANELLAGIYLTTKNYKDALTSLDNIKTKSESANMAYQKVAYYRGIEFYNNNDYPHSIGLFDKVIVSKSDPKLQSLAMFWKAEALYAQNNFDAAIKEYRIFVFNPPSMNTSVYNNANYGLGYCYFKKENYSEASSWFRKYLKNKDQTDTRRFNDASLRVADGFFVQRDYVNAVAFYDDAISNSATSTDYCLFQKGIIAGLQSNMNKKSDYMQQIIDKYPKSSYSDDAVFEKGNALFGLGKEEEAKTSYEKILKNYPQSNYVKNSMLKIALVNFNANNDARAIEMYKQVLTKYPGTPEAAEALNGIKNVSVNSGNPNQYFDVVKSIPNASISAGAEDSITYEAAEQVYSKGDNKNSSKSFGNYIQKFPHGNFIVNATFYKALCDYNLKDYASALTGFESVIAFDKNSFTEKSLVQAANIQFRNKNYDKALEYYSKLEQLADFKDNQVASFSGQMRCYYIQNKYDHAIIYAQKLLETDKVPNELINEAHLTYGRSAMATNDLTNASREFSFAAKVAGSEISAEAKYNLAFIQYKLGNFKESQKKAFDVIHQDPGYDFWIGKSFILLADDYVALKDTFQAKQTLQSVLDNYERNVTDAEDIKAIAKEKLDAINNDEMSKAVKPEESNNQKEQEEEEKDNN